MKALEVEVLEVIATYYKGARGRGTRGDCNLFKLILGASLISASNTMFNLSSISLFI
ncbi:hypothetical protein GIB67_003970 [Kingdonia uniflora]|uniref:Uncharacterized protein n=1 Tax=Kingdonia uniflora TaxID=39325 RepID=A0A7J7NRL1_9MAGN|nr:hypothetical protein GIB67_003970 [Kingdonia uniflora]